MRSEPLSLSLPWSNRPATGVVGSGCSVAAGPALDGGGKGGPHSAVQCLSLVSGFQKDSLGLELVASLSLIIFAH